MAKGLPDYRYMSYPAIVPEGGLGVGTLALNGVLLGNVTSPVKVATAGAADAVLRVPAAGGEPAFGALDLSKAAAVTGILPVAGGGTGTATPALVAGANITITGTWPNNTIAASGAAPSAAAFLNAATDFLHYSSHAPWVAESIDVGTCGPIAGSAQHPGVARYTSSTTANSGYRHLTATSCLLLAGTETGEFIFQVITTGGTTVRLGFQSPGLAAAPTNGAWIHIAATTLTGKTSATGAESTTGTSYTITASTWYRVKMVVNAGATQVDFYLYNEAGTQLWTNYLTTNIPTAAGQGVGQGAVAVNSGTAAVILLYLDFMSLVVTRTLTR